MVSCAFNVYSRTDSPLSATNHPCHNRSRSHTTQTRHRCLFEEDYTQIQVFALRRFPVQWTATRSYVICVGGWVVLHSNSIKSMKITVRLAKTWVSSISNISLGDSVLPLDSETAWVCDIEYVHTVLVVIATSHVEVVFVRAENRLPKVYGYSWRG